MEKEIVSQVQEAQRVPYRINPRRNMPRHLLIKLTKTKHKERILKAAREKQQVIYKGNPIGLTADLSAETLQARKERQDIFKVLKGKNLQPRLLYSARISFKIDGEIKSFTDKQKLREFSTTKPALQQMLKGLLYQEIIKRKNQPQTIKKTAIGTSVQFSSVAQLCPILCDPMNHSMPGLPVHHQLPEFMQTHVHRVSDAIQPSHPLSSPSPPAPNPSQHQSLFQ